MIDCDESQTMVQYTKTTRTCIRDGNSANVCAFFIIKLSSRKLNAKRILLYINVKAFFSTIFNAMEIKAKTHKIYFLLFTFRFGHEMNGIIIWTHNIEAFSANPQSRPYQTFMNIKCKTKSSCTIKSIQRIGCSAHLILSIYEGAPFECCFNFKICHRKMG